MPYIITYVPRGCRAEDMERRHAVATIEEARDSLQPIVREPADPRVRSELISQLRCLPESGGVIGPLPDGYVIEVQHVSDANLRAAIPACNTFPCELHVDGQDLIDAYNAA